MNITIEDRMDSIEQQLKELRKEMEESIARYRIVQDGEKMPYYPFTHGDISKFRSGQIGGSAVTKEEYIEQVFSEVDHLPNREAIGTVLEHLLGEIYELRLAVKDLGAE